jgi:hypothetical protein
LSMLSEMTMKSEVNWMDTIPEFEARMQEETADDFLLFSPVKKENQMKSTDLLAILAFNAVHHQAKRSSMELKSNITVLETLLQESDSLTVSPTNDHLANNASTLQSSDIVVDDTKKIGNDLSDVEEEEEDAIESTVNESDVMDSVGKNDTSFNIVEALDKIHPTSVWDDALSSRGVDIEQDNELRWVDDDLKRAKDCLSALAFFGFQ